MIQKQKAKKKPSSQDEDKLVGTAARAKSNILAVPIYEELSREAGIPYTLAKNIYLSLGKVIQRRLRSGKACGIPYVCTLFVDHWQGRRFYIAKTPLFPNLPARWLDYRKRPKARPNILWQYEVREAISRESPFGKSLSEQYLETRLKLKKKKGKKHE